MKTAEEIKQQLGDLTITTHEIRAIQLDAARHGMTLAKHYVNKERVEETGHPEDTAYNYAIRDAIDAIDLARDRLTAEQLNPKV